MKRPETGTMQFGDDWPGVFIRGDDAFGFAVALEGLLKGTAGAGAVDARFDIPRIWLQNLLTLLRSADVRTKPTPQKARLE